MKELSIGANGEISLYSEDGDDWEKLLDVIKKIKEIDAEVSKAANEKEGFWAIRILRRIFY
jgi:hypothetical protein